MSIEGHVSVFLGSLENRSNMCSLLGASIDDYVFARAHRELACLQTCKHFPRQQGLFYGPGQYQPTVQRKQETLSNYLKVANFYHRKTKKYPSLCYGTPTCTGITSS